MAEEEIIWGIHMGWRHGRKPLDNGFVSIGWSSVGDLGALANNRDAFKQAVTAAYPNKKPGAIPVDAGTLFRFAKEMKRGDLVIYPSKPDRMINFGTVQSDYKYRPDADAEAPNVREIKWLKHFPRASFSQNALHEIGSAVTLFQVKNNAEEFLSAFRGNLLPTSEVDEETIEAVAAATEEATADFIIKRLKSALDPYQFEAFVAHLLERMGYHARVTQKSGDGGVDIIAHKDELGFEPPIIKVQCKQILSTIGQPDVAQLYGHVEQREHGLFVTLGNYSPQARQFERSKHNLRLIDGEALTELIFNHYDRFDPRYQMLLPLKKAFIPGVVADQGAT
ncbi:MAG: restriction endonuclease [Deltaproteobacteria bacterium]|nr:restriction endonuclease [Deltaproteobacteria bacterium]